MSSTPEKAKKTEKKPSVPYKMYIVEAITEGGRDYEVTVNFEKFGTKKMFASFAKLKKI